MSHRAHRFVAPEPVTARHGYASEFSLGAAAGAVLDVVSVVPGRTEPVSIGIYQVDEGYLETMVLRLIAGRWFDDNRPLDDMTLPFPPGDAAALAAISAAGGAGIAVNRLRRSRGERWIGGVCGGLAALTGLEAWAWRLLFVLGLLLGGVTLFIYVAMWILVPEEPA